MFYGGKMLEKYIDGIKMKINVGKETYFNIIFKTL
jgi:hypothetical protein